MKFWAYFDGEVEGPYTVEALAKRGGVGPTTLVCPESSGGDAEQDWQLADYYPELAETFGFHHSGEPELPLLAVPLEPEPPAELPQFAPPLESQDRLRTPDFSEDLISLQHRMEQLGLSPSEDDEAAALDEERRRLAEKTHLRRVINRRTAEVIGTIEAGLDDAGKKIDRQLRRFEYAKLSEPQSDQQDTLPGGIRALGPLFPSWRQNLDSNELLQIAASDTALFSTLQSGRTVVVPDKPVWPERKAPKGRPPVISAPAEPKPAPQPEHLRPLHTKAVPHPFARPVPVVPETEEPVSQEEPIPHQEVSELMAAQEPVSGTYTEAIPAEAPAPEAVALPELPVLRPADEHPAQAEPQPEAVPEEEAVKEELLPEQPVAEEAAPAPEEAAVPQEEPAPQQEAQPAPASEPTPAAIPPVEKPISTPIRQAMSDFDFPFSPKYLGKAPAGEESALPADDSHGKMPEQLGSHPALSSSHSATTEALVPLTGAVGGAEASTPKSPSQALDAEKQPPSFNLSDTVPLLQQQGNSTLSAASLDPRLAENSKSTLAPGAMLNLSKTTMYGNGAAQSEGAVAPQQPLQSVHGRPEKPVRSVKTLVMLLFAAVFAVGGAVVFFFLRQDAGVKGSSSQASDTATDAATEQPVSQDTTAQATVPPPAPPPAQEPAAPVRTAGASVQAVEIAKNHDLGMGKGKLAAWLQSSYGASGQQDWSATQLLGDVYVVQYQLLRARLEPIAYQFEVNVKEGRLTKGINNSAIELLGGGTDLPSAGRAKAKPAATRKPVDKRRNTKKKRSES